MQAIYLTQDTRHIYLYNNNSQYTINRITIEKETEIRAVNWKSRLFINLYALRENNDFQLIYELYRVFCQLSWTQILFQIYGPIVMTYFEFLIEESILEWSEMKFLVGRYYFVYK